jgi:hypothetical protein
MPVAHLNNADLNYFFMTRPWCSQGSSDYCPLVISIILFVILVSLTLILCLWLNFSIRCERLRKYASRLRRFVCRKPASNNDPLNNSAMFAHMQPNLIPFDNSSSSSDPIWFIGVPKNFKPPPTYAQSQQDLKQKRKNRTIFVRTCEIPLTEPIASNQNIQHQQANINNAFTLENLDVLEFQPEISQNVFPSYQCLTLTTQPRVMTLQAIASQQLFKETSDEIPPAYDSIIQCPSAISRTRSLIQHNRSSNASRAFSTLNRSSS